MRTLDQRRKSFSIQHLWIDNVSDTLLLCQRPSIIFLIFFSRVEMRGLEPLTLALQKRCSPS
jgi:hypothetical protein